MGWLAGAAGFGMAPVQCKCPMGPGARGVTMSAQAFPSVPAPAVHAAMSSGLDRAAAREGLPMHELLCDRDYSTACPLGVRLLSLLIAPRGSWNGVSGWADLGDASTCKAPRRAIAIRLRSSGSRTDRRRRSASQAGAGYLHTASSACACLGLRVRLATDGGGAREAHANRQCVSVWTARHALCATGARGAAAQAV